ncbi:MAG: hypothetical protein CMM59_08765 [Rhodospirillaceae bacterium]|nr:hypothetical protein [Rhodospirillaceae bacterium]
MPVSNVLSSAISGLTSSAERAGKAAERIVTADVPKQAGSNSSLDVQDTVSLSDPALARIEGQVELSQASTNFKANAAVIRAEDERSERLLDITA